ncbi:Rad61p [Saccharomyces eubayanus]|uniref:Rad61p n=1 Tax=Saccharomyces eubayanus TaxID=1080349 RepID=UPI0006BF9C9A|nr:RAD61-like protein [Saccharomyces eubayanus]KOH00872.1 RAD61-like protein [Saccharomyces eubayanus]
MRAYGRRGPVFRSSLKSNRGSSSSSNVEFSDDDVNSIIPDLSSTMSSSIADHPVEVFLDKHDPGEHASTSFVNINEDALSQNSKESIQDVKTITSDDTSLVLMKKEKLSAFDFLDGSKTSKRKKRRTYQRHDTSIESSIELNGQDEDGVMTQNESESAKQIYNDINEFILNLPKADDDVFNKMFENELKEDNVEEEDTSTLKNRKYGKSRTILINKNKDDEIAEEEDDDQRANTIIKNNGDSSNTEKEGLSSTNHYNELKNMGDTIKYQDDIEFFLSNSKNDNNDEQSINDYFKILLNLSLMIVNDDGFFQYAKRYFKKEVIKLVFSRVKLDFAELLLLQGYLLNKVSESQCDFPSNFEVFSIELSRNTSKVSKRNKHMNKLSSLNFEDFLRKTHFKTGLSYSLSLWSIYGKFSKDIVKRISTVASDRYLFNQDINKILHLLEKIVSSSTFGLIFIKQPDMLDGVVGNIKEEFKNMVDNDSLIKVLILLTNIEGYGHSLNEDMDAIYQDSMNTILNGIYPLIDTKVDIILLHLGLCLNICGRKSSCLKIDEKLWRNMKATFVKMILDDSEVENRLTQGLFYLNFAFVVNQQKDGDLNSKDLNKLLVELEAFKLETSQFNVGISNKIEAALHYLKSAYKRGRSTS